MFTLFLALQVVGLVGLAIFVWGETSTSGDSEAKMKGKLL